jgi:hypothetical protein
MSKILCDPYIWENPAIIFDTPLFPDEFSRCMSDRLNQVIYVGVVFAIIGFAAAWKMNSNIPLVFALFLGLIVTGKSVYTIVEIIQKREGFRNPDKLNGNVDIIGKKNEGLNSAPVDFPGIPKRDPLETAPTPRNPFMNVLVDELKYNPTRPRAASVNDPKVRLELDDFFRTEFYNDPTDVFGKTQGQRQFITMPSTSIPNDVDSYQNWLYRIPGKTCKEGGREACLPGTDGAALPWLNQESRVPLSDEDARAQAVNRNPAPYAGSAGLGSSAL